MMINCPIDEKMLCQECRFNTDDKCWWFFPARPLKEILTVEERLETQQPLEHIHRHINYTSSMSKQDWDLLQQTARGLKYLEKKLAKHTEYKKKRQPKYS